MSNIKPPTVENVCFYVFGTEEIMKKLTKILLISASMILASCGGGDKPADSSTPAASTPTSTSSKVESQESKPASSSQAPATSSQAPATSSSTPAASSSTPTVGGWENDGAKVGEAQPVKNTSANQTGYELVATGKEVANGPTGKWDNGKLKGDLEWSVTGMAGGKYEVYLSGEFSAYNGAKNFIQDGDIPEGLSRYTFQADSEPETVITASESYEALGWSQTGSGAAWTNKALAEIEIKDGTATFAIRYHATGYSVYLAAVRLVRVGDLPPAPTPGTGTVTLADGATTLSEGADGITVDNTTNEIHFTKEGIYAVTGTLTNGSLIVDEEVGEGTVEIDLTGTVNISRSGADTSAPIVGNHVGKLKVKKDGKTSVATITDTRTLSKNAANTSAIYAKGYLDVPGGGKLNITTNGNGLESKTRIETKKGELTIDAGKKGIYARRSVLLGEEGGKFNITATSHAVEIEAKADAVFEEEELQGVCLVDGTFNLKGGKKGINCDYLVDIQGGTGTIESTGGDRAINAKSNLIMSGGTFTYKSTEANDLKDNAIKADLGAVVSGGNHTLESEVKAFVSPKDIAITGGELKVAKSTEGIEANNVTISGETTVVEVKATANGINATAPALDEGETAPEGKPTIKIEGGKTYVEALGDGLDSNGDILVTGGFTVVNQSGAGNTAIDYGSENGGTFKQNGGVLVAYGANEAAPENTGTQRSVIAATEGCTTGEFFKVANGETNYYIQPQTATAYQLYVSAPSFANGVVTVSKLASATAGILEFKGVYSSATEEGAATVLGTGTFSDTALHLNTIPAA